jgi:amino-acid N-acetyltransferase
VSSRQKRNCNTQLVMFDFAEPTDERQIRTLLFNSSLPFQDIQEHISHFITARNEDELIGCIGLEVHGKYGLLRSLAVVENYRGNGIGEILCKRLLEYAQQRSVQEVYLLTTTAADFFRKRGFSNVDRSDAPGEIKATLEFTSLCPSSSTLMKYRRL